MYLTETDLILNGCVRCEGKVYLKRKVKNLNDYLCSECKSLYLVFDNSGDLYNMVIYLDSCYTVSISPTLMSTRISFCAEGDKSRAQYTDLNILLDPKITLDKLKCYLTFI